MTDVNPAASPTIHPATSWLTRRNPPAGCQPSVLRRGARARAAEDVDGPGGGQDEGQDRDGGLGEHEQFRPAGEGHGVGGLKALALA
jgi:hypothetical protein